MNVELLKASTMGPKANAEPKIDSKQDPATSISLDRDVIRFIRAGIQGRPRAQALIWPIIYLFCLAFFDS